MKVILFEKNAKREILLFYFSAQTHKSQTGQSKILSKTLSVKQP
jgi:hypothetical protein